MDDSLSKGGLFPEDICNVEGRGIHRNPGCDLGVGIGRMPGKEPYDVTRVLQEMKDSAK